MESVRELEKYLTDHRWASEAGKRGYLSMTFEREPDKGSVMHNMYRRAPIIVQRELYFDSEMPQMPCVYILSAGGPMIDGDRFEQHILVKRGAEAHISTGAATKVAEMKYDYATMRQHFVLEDDAYLEVMPEPIIPCRHSRYITDTLLSVAGSATAVCTEIYLPGRRHYGNGERFEYDLLSATTRAERADHTTLMRERFVIEPHRHNPCVEGVLGRYDTFATVTVITSAANAKQIFDRTEAKIDPPNNIEVGVAFLPNDCGLSFKVLGLTTAQVKGEVRQLCSSVRQQVKGHPLPDEFVWR